MWTFVERLISGWALSASQWQLYSATLIPSTHSAPVAVCHSEIVTVVLHSAFLNIHRSGLLTALFGCCMAIAVTRGWNRNRNKSQHRMEKNSSRRCCRESNPRSFDHERPGDLPLSYPCSLSDTRTFWAMITKHIFSNILISTSETFPTGMLNTPWL